MKLIYIFSFLINLIYLQAQQNKPNFVWVVCEDISPDLSFYGDSIAKTPNLDALAKQSYIYTKAYATTPVCGPSRSAIITGMLPTSIGTMHMRTGNDVMSWGKNNYKETILKGENSTEIAVDITNKPLREYSAVIPENVKCFTEYLRINGYYCTNNQKTDYQFAAPQSAWDENDTKAHWRNAPKEKPFFSVFNFGETHESNLWKNNDLPLTVDPKKVKVPPYLPDNDIVRNDIARHYSNIEIMDKKIGEIIKQLKEDGLYDSTYIFFYSDHGGPLPHEKREIHNEGLQVPLIIKTPYSNTSDIKNELVSLMDLGPTLLSLATIKIEKHIEGKPFLGKFKKDRKFIYATSDRFDEHTDRIRMVRTEKMVYIKNYYPNLVKYKDVKYRYSIPSMINMLNLKDSNQLTTFQNSWFLTKEKEELYDESVDPFHQNNLISNQNYQKALIVLRSECVNQFEKKYDYASIPETEMILKMWPNNIQPSTKEVNYTLKNETITLNCATKGATILYKYENQKNWTIYTKPFKKEDNKVIQTKAIRIGFKESLISSIKKF